MHHRPVVSYWHFGTTYQSHLQVFSALFCFLFQTETLLCVIYLDIVSFVCCTKAELEKSYFFEFFTTHKFWYLPSDGLVSPPF
jgi:hypothetical protein